MSSLSRSDPRPALDWEAPIRGTWAWLVVLVAVHLGTGWLELGRASAWEAFFGTRSARLRAMVGGQHTSLVAEDPWRLWTSVLLHADALHLAVNALALVALGRLLEPRIGPIRLSAWLLAGGVAGSIASHLAGMVQSDGISGGLYALLGALVAHYWRERRRLHPEDRRLLGPVLHVFLVLNLVLSAVLPFVDLVGHLGGLACGLVLGAIGSDRANGLDLAWLGLSALMLGLGVASLAA